MEIDPSENHFPHWILIFKDNPFIVWTIHYQSTADDMVVDDMVVRDIYINCLFLTVSPGKSDHSMMNTTLSPSRSYDSQLNKLQDHPTPLSASKRSDYVVLVLFINAVYCNSLWRLW